MALSILVNISPGAWRHQAITPTNDGKWSVGSLGKNFSEIKFESKYNNFHSAKCTLIYVFGEKAAIFCRP